MATHITTSGGLISAAFIENIRELGCRQTGIEPESFRLPWATAPKGPAALEGNIAAAWELLKERWDAVRAELPRMDAPAVRARWLIPLLQTLDFDPIYQRGDMVLDAAGQLRFPISHRGWSGEGAPAIHTVASAQELDARLPKAQGARKALAGKSPHDMLQAFLNCSRGDQWAVLTNGVVLRLLRDYHHTFTKGYVEFDLEAIFEGREYGDFRALYRMCHASRFAAQGAGDTSVQDDEAGAGDTPLRPLERFYKDSLATGIKAGEELRGQVRQAIEILGNGFLDGELIGRLEADTEACRRYYGEILRLIYRMLFLLFAEQRGMLPAAGAPLESLYREQYSLTALRGRAEGDIPLEDAFGDAWHGLLATFRMVREGAPALGVFGYDGMLFEDEQTGGEGECNSPLRGRGICNSDLLRAVRALTLIEREGTLQRISYADLGVEELGSIYESLLDYTPRVGEGVCNTPLPATGGGQAAVRFYLDARGAERKTTGSYYTHPSLVNELIKSALLPVVRERLAAAGLPVVAESALGEAGAGLLTDYAGLSAAQREAGEAALLALKVCDPAAGSGHFLVKANNVLGAELARVRAGEEYPTEELMAAARRDVLAHCLYAVDLNPMAVELCKVSLWINASVRDQPLNFLDHHIKCGNSLIGTTPALLARGLPDEAFTAVSGDDKAVATAVRKRNKQEREAHAQGARQPALWRVAKVYAPANAEWATLDELAEKDPQAARRQYDNIWNTEYQQNRLFAADLWTAAFFWPLVGAGAEAQFPTEAALRLVEGEGPRALPAELVAGVRRLAEEYRFFHWHLEFPEVFEPPAQGGFDAVLSNPPWESLEFKTEEFFANRAPAITAARNQAERDLLILDLRRSDPALFEEYEQALWKLAAVKRFAQHSHRLPLTESGTVNLYALFAELDRELAAGLGRVGIVVPTSIATEWTYRNFFTEVLHNGELVSLHDFQNRRSDGGIWFPGVHASYRFCLLTLGGSRSTTTRLTFFTDTIDDIYSPANIVELSSEDMVRINPNTLTVPVFRSQRDAQLTRGIYVRVPAMIIEEGARNDWQVEFKQGLFNISSTSERFRDRAELSRPGLNVVANHFVGERLEWLPTYEDWMIHQFDHRYNSHETGNTSETQHEDPSFVSLPRYWVDSKQVATQAVGFPQQKWFVVFRDRARTTDMRTAIFSVVPVSAVTHPIPMVGSPLFNGPPVCLALANFNSFVFDYVVRQKLSGYHLAFYVLKQQAMLPPARYDAGLLAFIVPRVLELTYTAWDIAAFADDVWREAALTPGPSPEGGGGLRAAIERQWQENAAETGGGHAGAAAPEWVEALTPGPLRQAQGAASPKGRGERFPHPPFKWDEERRARLRAELDGLYARLYGLSREELEYVLETFPIVRRKDEARWGEYRTKRMVVEAYESLRG